MKTEDLLTSLTQDLKPVRRVAHPLTIAFGWLAFAAVVILLATLVFGLSPDLPRRMARGTEVIQLLLAGITGVLAAIAAFQVAMPDRDDRWALLPLPTAAVWVATLGFGCLQDVWALGWDGLRTGLSLGCLQFIVGFGVPLTATVLWLARHAAPLRPGPVAALGGLAAAAIANVGLTLVHPLDAAAETLLWHGGSIALVVLLARAATPMFRRAAAQG